MENNLFESLFSLNVNDKVERKKVGGSELTYLSWAWAWGEFKHVYPEAQYKIKYWDDKPYMYDENLGYMVETEVTAGGLTHGMWLPVMDGANKPMKKEPYKYQTKFGEKDCAAADMFDINKTLMRCLVKNLAMFGLGLYIYAGEDLPETPFSPMTEAQKDELIKLDTDLERMCQHFNVSTYTQISSEQAEGVLRLKRSRAMANTVEI